MSHNGLDPTWPPAAGSPPGPSCSDVHSVVGSMLCHPSNPLGWLSAVSFTLWHWLQAWWPLLAVAAALALTVGALLARVLVRARRHAAEHARWVEIIPPASLPRDGAPALWRAVAGMLHRTTRHGVTPRHLAVEFVADQDGVRAGIWVPPALPVRRMDELIGQVWPGARARLVQPPRWTDDDSGTTARRVTAAEVYPAGGPWVPLADAAPRTTRAVEVGDDDVLRGLLSALSACEPGERMCVQLIVTAQHGTTDRRGRPWWARLLLGLARLPGLVVLEVADVFLSHHSSQTASAPTVRAAGGQDADDPVIQARRRAIVLKQAHGPHLRVTLRVAYSGPGSRRTHRRIVSGLAGTFDLAAPLATLRIHPAGSTRRTAARVDGRRAARGRFRFAATITELAGLWHLPVEPTQYGMTDSVGRVRRPARRLPRLRRDGRDRRRNDRRRPDTGSGGQGAWDDAA